MSRIGKLPVKIPQGVEVNISETSVTCKGPKGELSIEINPCVLIEKEESEIKIVLKDGCDSALWGTYRQHIFNMVNGVTKEYEKKLEVVGVGFKAQAQGDKLVLNIGFTHPVEIKAPKGINFKVEKNIIIVSGIDKQLVGQIAAEIRAYKVPEPYKGKGIRYIDEHVRKKEGKKAVATAE